MILGICPICKLGVSSSGEVKFVKKGNRTITYHMDCYKKKYPIKNRNK